MNGRIALPLSHKDEKISNVANTLLVDDIKRSKYPLFVINRFNEEIMLSDFTSSSGEMQRKIDNLFKDSIEGKELDVNAYPDSALVFIVKRDSNGKPYIGSSNEVIDALKSFRKEHISKFKPYQLNVSNDGVKTKVLPILSEETVFTYVSFDNITEYRTIKEVTEKYLERLTAAENNITTRVMDFYDNCMITADGLHLIDVNQDADLINLFSRMSDAIGVVEAVSDWLPEILKYQPAPKKYQINLSTSDDDYMYKYVLSDRSNLNTGMIRTAINCKHGNRYIKSSLEHSKDGILLTATVNKSFKEDYIVRTMDGKGNYPYSTSLRFLSNPASVSKSTSGLLGDVDNLINIVTGSIVSTFKTDIPGFAVKTKPWIQVNIMCYNVNGSYIKTVQGIWDKTGTNQLILEHGSYGNTYTFRASLGGNYRVKYEMRVFWGQFAAWSDEVEIAYFGLDRGNNSGGTFNLNKYIFDGKTNRILTRYQLINASKYEKSTTIDGKSYGWSATFNPPITPAKNTKFIVPRSANWHYTRWYGKFTSDDQPVQRVEWHNESRNKVVDMSNSLHYHNTAQNYGILTNVSLNLTGTGPKAVYRTYQSNRPYIYPPIDKDCTIMLRGGHIYNIVSDSQSLEMTQVDIFKVENTTFEMEQQGTVYYGDELYLANDIIIQGSTNSYIMNFIGSEETIGIFKSTPRVETLSNEYKMLARSKTTYDIPEEEKGMGALYKLNIDFNKFILHPFYILKINDIEVNIKYTSISDEWLEVYNEDNIRIYLKMISKDFIHVMTYGINASIVRLFYKDPRSLEMVFLDPQTREVIKTAKLLPEKPEGFSIPININDNEYWIELIESKPPKIVNIISDNTYMNEEYSEIKVIFDRDIESSEIEFYDEDGKLIGYLK